MLKFFFQLTRFCDFKNYLKEIEAEDSAFKFCEADWKLIDDIIDVLAAPYFVSKRLQTEAYTLSDFYGEWIMLQANLKQKCQENGQNCLAKILLSKMIARQPEVLSTQMILKF